MAAAQAVLDAKDPEAPALVLILAELALATGNAKAIIDGDDILSRAADGADQETSVRLMLVLAEAKGDEAAWRHLLDRAEPATVAMATRLAALVFARRGRFLYWAGGFEGAEAAYRSAVERACRARLPQDAAEWMLARWRILQRASVLDDEMWQLPRRAAAVRATGSGGLLQRGYDPRSEALQDLLAEKLNSALPELRRYLRDSVRVAHLEDELEAHNRLGELYERTKREPAAAIQHFIAAGKGKEAARVAAATTFYVDCSELAEHPQAQTRASALQATAAQADLVPDADVKSWVRRALKAATSTRGGLMGPQPWVQGFAVLAGLAARIPAEDVDAVLAAVNELIPRQVNHYTWADDSIVDIVAGLALGQPERRHDFAARMIAILDQSDSMARRLMGHDEAIAACLSDLREPLRKRAAQGHRQAMQILAIHGDTEVIQTLP
jgi:tetratricopeptide (TPR) repeat protein